MTEPAVRARKGLQERVRRRWPCIVLGLITFLFFWQYFIFDVTPFGGDTAFVFIPFRSYIVSRLAHGELPIWNPYLFGGTPSTGEPQYQCWYLPNLLLFVLGVPRGMGWMFPLHLLFAAAGTYLFARRSLGLGQPPAVVAALTFAFGGCMQSRLINSPYIEAAAWMPWILLAYDYAARRGGAALVLPGAAIALQLCTGGPQYTYYLLLLLPFYHWYQLRSEETVASRTRRLWRWQALGATLLLGASLTAVQMIPALELARLSERGTHATYAYVAGNPMAARRFFASLVFPKFWGSFSAMPLGGYAPTVELGYLGVIPLGLIAAAVAADQRRRQVYFWAIVTVATLVLAFGDNTPLYPVLYRFLPGTATFRTPAHWLVMTSFAGALVAGMGMQAILDGATSARRAARVAVATLTIILLVGVVLLLSPAGVPAFQTPQTPYGPWGQVVVIAASALLFLPWCLPMRRHMAGDSASVESDPVVAQSGSSTAVPMPAWIAMVLLLLIFDLFAVSQDMEMQHTVPVAAVEKTPATAALMPTQPVPERFWSGGAELPLEPWQVTGAPLPMTADEFRARNAPVLLAVMPSCIAAQFQRCGLTGAWGALMPMRRNARPIYQPDTPLDVRRRWFRLLNVRYYLSLRQLEDSELQLKSQDIPLVYADAHAMPRAYTVGRARLASMEQAPDIISSSTFEPHSEVLLEARPAQDGAASAPGAAFSPAQVVSYAPEHLVLACDASHNGYLVLMDNPYPGWGALIDGEPAPLYTANFVGRAVPVPAGHHTVAMWFDSPSLRMGLFITLCAVAACAGIVAVGSGYRAVTPTS